MFLFCYKCSQSCCTIFSISFVLVGIVDILQWFISNMKSVSIKQCVNQGDGYDVHLKMISTGWCGLCDYIPSNIRDLREHIISGVIKINRHKLIQVWQGLDYHVDVCSLTPGTRWISVEVKKTVLSSSFILIWYQ